MLITFATFTPRILKTRLALVPDTSHPLIYVEARAKEMAFGWEKHRDEICDLYLYQHKTMKQVMTHMQEKYGLSAWYVLGLL